MERGCGFMAVAFSVQTALYVGVDNLNKLRFAVL
jgi:hypothetical protein